VSGQYAADAELDVVGVGADRENALALARALRGAAGAAIGGEAHDRGDEVGCADRLDEEFVGLRVERSDGIVDRDVGRHNDNGDAGVVGADLLHQLETVDAGHLDVGDDHVGQEGVNDAASERRIGDRLDNTTAALLQHRLGVESNVGVVFDDYNTIGLGHGGSSPNY
jgi:hypothetical protein